MRIAVTGAAGFVGSAVVRECLRRGHEVHAIDDLRTGHRDWLPAGVVLDMGPAEHATYADDDSVIHCAATADISRNWDSILGRSMVWENGADTTYSVLERSSQRVPPIPFVYVSTCAVYGGGRVQSSDTRTRASSPYAASKLAGEALVDAWTFAGRIRGAIVRLVSCVGQNYHHGHLADFVAMAREGCIHARDDGSQRHSYVHVDDAARAIVSAATMRDRAFAEIFNVSGGPWSWRDTVEIMRETRPVDVRPGPRRSAWVGDPIDLDVDSDVSCPTPVAEGVREALRSLGWRP